MDFSWAASIPPTSASFLVPLKRFSGVRVAEVNELIWLQGEPVSQQERLNVEVCLQKISGACRFDRLADGQLIPSGYTLPTIRLPQISDEEWTLLTDWIIFRFPDASLPGAIDEHARIKIEITRHHSVSLNETRQPTILLCRVEEFVAWAEHASDHRIRRLSFACDAQGGVVVRGTPLPSLPGKTFVDHEQVAVETGHSWWPAVSIGTLKKILCVNESRLLLCQAGEKFQSIESSDFVAATRSGIRATGKKFENLREASR